MLKDHISDDPLLGFLQEKHISFNLTRSTKNQTSSPRKVTLINSTRERKTVIPGMKIKKEKSLLKELKSVQHWPNVERHSFEISPYFFSFLWRFKLPKTFRVDQLWDLEAIDDKSVRLINAALKRYQTSLRSDLKPGQIYLIPDAEVTFSRLGRSVKPYARRVLVYHLRNDQLGFMPISTKIPLMDKNIDILFDSKGTYDSLNPNGFPTVENFPYKMFSRRESFLAVKSLQFMPSEEFIEFALSSIGTVRKELMVCIREKMKILYSTT